MRDTCEGQVRWWCPGDRSVSLQAVLVLLHDFCCPSLPIPGAWLLPFSPYPCYMAVGRLSLSLPGAWPLPVFLPFPGEWLLPRSCPSQP